MRLRAHYASRVDPERWWPGETPFAVMAGAILVQHTAWRNVLPALDALRRARALSPAGVRRLGWARLAALVRPAGCWRAKTRYLMGLADFVEARYGGSVARMLARPTEELRDELLGVAGIGRETADAMLLYAGAHPTFVVDAYTRRILGRHGLGPGARAGYEAWRSWLLAETALPEAGVAATADGHARRYREWHALLVETAKRFCRRRNPDCPACPLRPLLPAAGAIAGD